MKDSHAREMTIFLRAIDKQAKEDKVHKKQKDEKTLNKTSEIIFTIALVL
jgi:hypothetical protein